MFNYGDDGYPQEDDEQFYNETVYNEDYYIEHEREIISDSDLELELGRLENEAIREMREEGLLRPTVRLRQAGLPKLHCSPGARCDFGSKA